MKKKITFLSFDKFSKQKVNFFNNVNKELNKKNFVLSLLSSEDIEGLKFHKEKILIGNKKLSKNDEKILSILKLKKKQISEIQKVLKLYYPKDSIKLIKSKTNFLVSFFLSHFISNKPVLAIVWTEYYPLSRIFISMCNLFDINYLVCERGILRETITLEEEGIYGKSILVKKKIKKEKNFDEYSKFLKFYNYLQVGWKQKNDHSNFLKNDLGKKKIFFIGTNEIWHGFYPYLNKTTSPFYKSHFDVIRHLSKLGKKFPEIEVFYKPHPKDRIYPLYKKKIPKNIIILEKCDVYKKIEQSDLVITIASSLACDALIKGKQVFILGKFEISNKKICHELKNKSDLEKNIKFLVENKLNTNFDYWKSFANYLLKSHLFNVSQYKYGKLNTKDFSKKLLKNIKNIKQKELSKSKKNLINHWIKENDNSEHFKNIFTKLINKLF